MVLGVEVGIDAERAVAQFMESSALLGEAARALARGSNSESLSALSGAQNALRRTREYIEQGQQKLSNLAHFLDQNRVAKYEQHLQNCGFRGSHFILAEYKQHLDRMRQSLIGAEERWPLAEEAVEAGELDNFLKDFSPGVNSAMRIVCRVAIDMLEFQHQIAETRYSLLSYEDTSFLRQ